jgi:hypothetical protein
MPQIDTPTIIGTTQFNALTANTVPMINGSKQLVSSTVSTTTLTYLDATSSIQTQLNSKQATLSTPTVPLTLTGTTLALSYSANLTVNGSSQLDTIQGIKTSSIPSFAGIILTNDDGVAGSLCKYN